jgi:hypothetical protein
MKHGSVDHLDKSPTQQDGSSHCPVHAVTPP